LTSDSLNYTKILRDPSAAVLQKYEAATIPRSFYIDSSGIIKAVKVGSFNSLAEIEAFLITP
jgi:hypothetical protein